MYVSALVVLLCQFVTFSIYLLREVLECFRKEELLNWEWFESTFSSCLRDGVTDGPATTVFSRDSEVGVAQWEDFRKRVVEHVSSGR